MTLRTEYATECPISPHDASCAQQNRRRLGLRLLNYVLRRRDEHISQGRDQPKGAVAGRITHRNSVIRSRTMAAPPHCNVIRRCLRPSFTGPSEPALRLTICSTSDADFNTFLFPVHAHNERTRIVEKSVNENHDAHHLEAFFDMESSHCVNLG